MKDYAHDPDCPQYGKSHCRNCGAVTIQKPDALLQACRAVLKYWKDPQTAMQTRTLQRLRDIVDAEVKSAYARTQE